MSENHLRRLAENVYFVEGEGNGKFPSCHGFLLTGRETMLVDAGMGKDRIEEIDRHKRIDVLVISHSHPDHVRYWHLLEDRHLLFPRETPAVVNDLHLLGERFTGTVEGGAHWVRMVRDGFGLLALRDPDGRYGDGDVLDIGGVQLEAVHTPGHIEDHYCFLERQSGTLLTTDIDFTSFGPWYGNPESDIEKFEASVKRVMALPYKRACSSHRLLVEGDAAQEFGAFLAAFYRQRNLILERCRKPSTFDEILDASPIYGNGMADKDVQRMFEGQMIAKNLTLLIRDGLVEELDGRFLAAIPV